MAPVHYSGSDQLRPRDIIALALAGLVVTVVTWPIHPPLYPDSCEYLAGVESLAAGRGLLDTSGRPQVVFPPGYSLFILPFLLAGVESLFAAKALSTLASLISLFPLTLLAFRLFGRTAALLAGAVYLVLPARVELANRVTTEPLYCLVVLTALWLWYRDSHGAEVITALLIGALLGVAFLIRPEGLLALTGLLVLGVVIRRRPPILLLRNLSLSVAAFAVVAGPYVIFLHGHTGKWQLTTKTEMNRRIGTLRSYDVPYDRIWRLNEDATDIDLSFGWVTDDLRSSTVRYARNVIRVGHEFATILGMLLLIPLVLGIWLDIRDRDTDLMAAGPLLSAMLFPLAFLPMFYVETRYVFPGALALLVLSAWQVTRRFTPRPASAPVRSGSALASMMPYLIVVALPACMIARAAAHPYDPAPLEDLAGWLARKVPRHEAVMSRRPEPVYLAGLTFFRLPYDTSARTLNYARHQQVRFLLTRRDTILHPDLAEATRSPFAGGQLRLIDTWHGPEGDWASLFEVGGVSRDNSPSPRLALARGLSGIEYSTWPRPQFVAPRQDPPVENLLTYLDALGRIRRLGILGVNLVGADVERRHARLLVDVSSWP